MTTLSPPPLAGTTTVAVDLGAATVAAAEQLLHDLEERLGAEAVLATTHFVDGRVVVVGEWEGGLAVPDDLDATTAASATARGRHVARTSGRLARFAGRAAVERQTTVGAVVARSVIDEVVALGGVPLDDEAPLDLREWARPELRAGRVVLVVQATAHGLLPFESRDQRPCCSAH